MAPRNEDGGDLPTAVVDCALYEDGERVPGHVGLNRILDRIDPKAGRFAWIGLYEPTAEQIQQVAAAFGLHPLAVEDAVHAHQRPKLERYGDTLFLVLKTIVYVDHEQVTATSEIVDTGEIMLFAGPGFAISVRHGSAPPLDGVRRRLEADPDHLGHGPAAIVHAVADLVVDRYLEVADAFQSDVEDLEAEVFSPDRPVDAARIYQLKRELLEFRRAVAPLSGPLQRLASGTVADIPAKVTAYLRDVSDHHQRAAETINGFDELVTDMLNASIAQLSVQQNFDMRRISAMAALIAVPTMIAGVYGMNFDHMPELTWRYGYPAVLTVIVIVCTLIYRALRRNKWL
ncbi:magnesium and cobalt transport protein CorA [Streptomyces sp. WAC04114]|uniref:magnesium and cobalt transport protein CorA n=1 Tax=Streptomyces sp. WAC04114 TaxID=2867961 RepID=UPI001C8C8D24|nr:magnesium and cobalt transport protein CorA [Streptomyces sp. WAC04114]MBX9360291.1 magnesium and cobalt transport protein CorA [Streptomyces sp. WAC04114]